MAAWQLYTTKREKRFSLQPEHVELMPLQEQWLHGKLKEKYFTLHLKLFLG